MHEPVLLHEVVAALRVRQGETFVDCTAGSGGHSAAVARSVGGPFTHIVLDEDEDALERTERRLSAQGNRAHLVQANFRDLSDVLVREKIDAADAILFDLGVSTEELLQSGRGFSFSSPTGADEPLLMSFAKYGREGKPTAREVVNRWSEENLAVIIAGFGEERNAKRIARAIAEARAKTPIETSKQLAEIVAGAIAKRGRVHPATKTFQAIRMAVNEELPALTEGLRAALASLAPGGRLAVISFHSGEDRIVKRMFKEAEKREIGTTSKKPLAPSQKEVLENPRARSAKLRVFIKNNI
mgnify:CR=1 FL=1